MPNTASAKKRVRQTDVRTLRNKDKRTAMRGYIRQLREAVEAKDKAKATALLPTAYGAVDKCAKHNIIHDNKAGHLKSQLARLVATLG